MQTDPQNGQFALTGSQAFELIKGVSETLAGRMAVVELKGLSLREVRYTNPFIPHDAYIEERKETLTEYPDIRKTIHRGSMP